VPNEFYFILVAPTHPLLAAPALLSSLGRAKNYHYQQYFVPLEINKVLFHSETIEVEGIDDASVIIRHLSVGITAETFLKPIVTNCLNLVHTKK
jgi:hypothetical protein